MCGRYALSSPLGDLVEIFDVPPVEFDHGPRYNIAPTQMAPVVATDRRGTRMGLLRWGLVPSWADDRSIGSRMINARAETLRSKPAFKEAAVSRRCLVPADGFYEWAKEGGRKIPFWIHPPDGAPLSFAGLWERWKRDGEEPVYSFTIITVDANDSIRHLHPRMPAIIPEENRHLWLDGSGPHQDALNLLTPFAGELDAYPVSTLVNSPANDVAECITPVST